MASMAKLICTFLLVGFSLKVVNPQKRSAFPFSTRVTEQLASIDANKARQPSDIDTGRSITLPNIREFRLPRLETNGYLSNLNKLWHVFQLLKHMQKCRHGLAIGPQHHARSSLYLCYFADMSRSCVCSRAGVWPVVALPCTEFVEPYVIFSWRLKCCGHVCAKVATRAQGQVPDSKSCLRCENMSGMALLLNYAHALVDLGGSQWQREHPTAMSMCLCVCARSCAFPCADTMQDCGIHEV